MRNTAVISILTIILALVACKSTPDGVLDHDDFVNLLVDVHKGEAYTDINFRDFRADSTKQAYKQSILAKHGISQADFDTTMMWYGAHIEDYLEVYDDVIARLEKEVAQNNATISASLSLVGDSVNTWTENSHYVLNRRSPSQFLQFYIAKDENWEPGDSYTWQLKAFNRQSQANWTMVIEYDDKTSEYRSAEIEEDGWNKITIVVDSLKNPIALYGFARFNIRDDEEIYLDSVSLIRNRVNVVEYRRRYNQKRFNFGIDNSQRSEKRREELVKTFNAYKKPD